MVVVGSRVVVVGSSMVVVGSRMVVVGSRVVVVSVGLMPSWQIGMEIWSGSATLTCRRLTLGVCQMRSEGVVVRCIQSHLICDLGKRTGGLVQAHQVQAHLVLGFC